MKYLEIYNLLEILAPHGEDGFSFDHNGDNFSIDIFFSERANQIKLQFESCSYLYFSPIPGYCPPKLIVDFDFKSSCLYELLDTNLLRGSEEIYSNPKYRPNRRHFFMHLGWANVLFHIVAKTAFLPELCKRDKLPVEDQY
ncbi:MAG: hypothetical protein ACK5LJ_03765 [Paracoccus sp. (in: a-proteobacteria)]